MLPAVSQIRWLVASFATKWGHTWWGFQKLKIALLFTFFSIFPSTILSMIISVIIFSYISNTKQYILGSFHGRIWSTSFVLTRAFSFLGLDSIVIYFYYHFKILKISNNGQSQNNSYFCRNSDWKWHVGMFWGL